ncbi:MAG: hypothetical protein U0452_03365 [Anaerolineae bacterium]
MSLNAASYQQSEEEFRAKLSRIGRSQSRWTFLSMMLLGGSFLLASLSPEIDSRLPAGFLLGMATGFFSTAVTFYFFENVFNERKEQRTLFVRQSGARRRVAALSVRYEDMQERQTALLGQISTLAPGGLPAYQPATRAAARPLLDVMNGLLETLVRWDAIEDERAAALRDLLAVTSEEGSGEDVQSLVDLLLAAALHRQQRLSLREQLIGEMRRIGLLLPTLPED